LGWVKAGESATTIRISGVSKGRLSLDLSGHHLLKALRMSVVIESWQLGGQGGDARLAGKTGGRSWIELGFPNHAHSLSPNFCTKLSHYKSFFSIALPFLIEVSVK